MIINTITNSRTSEVPIKRKKVVDKVNKIEEISKIKIVDIVEINKKESVK
jgi:hypothetical protein